MGLTKMEFEHKGSTVTIERWKSSTTGQVFTQVTCEEFDLEALKEAIEKFERSEGEEK